MIYAQPGQSFEATLDQTTTGLTGTLGVRIIDTPAGTTITARRTTGITEAPTGSGLYGTTLTAPATTGTYSVVWDDGAGNYSREDLTVTATLPVDGLPLGTDLCTVAEVKEFLQKNDTQQDAVIQSLITRGSAVIEQYCERQFSDRGTQTYVFEYDPGRMREGWLDLAPFDLRGNPTSVIVDSDENSPLTLQTVQYRVWPRPSTTGTYMALRLDPFGYGSGRFINRQVTITGSWGMSSVPADVKYWTIVTVGIWLRREVQAFTSVLKLDEDQVERPTMLPSSAARGLDMWRRQAMS